MWEHIFNNGYFSSKSLKKACGGVQHLAGRLDEFAELVEFIELVVRLLLAPFTISFVLSVKSGAKTDATGIRQLSTEEIANPTHTATGEAMAPISAFLPSVLPQLMYCDPMFIPSAITNARMGSAIQSSLVRMATSANLNTTMITINSRVASASPV